ncbi:hypothetical protein F383_32337 [Gossypium arboreum]|uniref:Uncharacterized protein n=1 Tax=Gossypium arboreum TaxID=29729 RepID=A0A0B0PPM2_GOSAR|nr:hypothetical protein F383_32337 [Gossypium arboreum]
MLKIWRNLTLANNRFYHHFPTANTTPFCLLDSPTSDAESQRTNCVIFPKRTKRSFLTQFEKITY